MELEVVTKEEAEKLISQALSEVDERYDLINKLALEHNIEVYACGPGGYGTGASLLLEDSKWHGLSRGDWLASSQSC